MLERNLTFIDTPGWTQDDLGNATGQTDVANMIETLMRQNAAVGSMTESQLLSLLTSGAGTQVDAVLYLLSGESIHLSLHHFCLLTYLRHTPAI